uniref:Uncharacterized protein n=1 Tax=Homalodisca liturata TaxID=320908 RepID=A0A1B6JTR5_9HEMI
MYKSVRDTLQAFSKRQLTNLNYSIVERLRSKNSKISVSFKPDRSQRSKRLKKVSQVFKKRKTTRIHDIFLDRLVNPIVGVFVPSIEGVDQISKLSDFRTHHGFLEKIEETETENNLEYTEGNPKTFNMNRALDGAQCILSPYGFVTTENKITKQADRKWFSKKRKPAYKNLNVSSNIKESNKSSLIGLVLEKIIYNKIDNLIPGVKSEQMLDLYDFRVQKENHLQDDVVEVAQIKNLVEQASSLVNVNSNKTNVLENNINITLDHSLNPPSSKVIVKAPEILSVDTSRTASPSANETNVNKATNQSQDFTESSRKTDTFKPTTIANNKETSASKPTSSINSKESSASKPTSTITNSKEKSASKPTSITNSKEASAGVGLSSISKDTKENITSQSDKQKPKDTIVQNPKRSSAKMASPESSRAETIAKTNSTNKNNKSKLIVSDNKKNLNEVQNINKTNKIESSSSSISQTIAVGRKEPDTSPNIEVKKPPPITSSNQDSQKRRTETTNGNIVNPEHLVAVPNKQNVKKIR